MAELENATGTPSLTKAEAEGLWGQLREGLANTENRGITARRKK